MGTNCILMLLSISSDITKLFLTFVSLLVSHLRIKGNAVRIGNSTRCCNLLTALSISHCLSSKEWEGDKG